MTEVSKKIWIKKMQNLQDRRKNSKPSSGAPNPIGDYKKHLSKVFVGNTLLDVGCGSRHLMMCVPDHVQYLGIDPFPACEEDGGFKKMEIEKCSFDDNSFETVCCFAALDNMYNIDKALEQMKRVASKNVVFLTGVDIEPDDFHTVKISHKELIEKMAPEFNVGYMEFLAPKVLLIEFVKNESSEHK